jgi:hypothetical protein
MGDNWRIIEVPNGTEETLDDMRLWRGLKGKLHTSRWRCMVDFDDVTILPLRLRVLCLPLP